MLVNFDSEFIGNLLKKINADEIKEKALLRKILSTSNFVCKVSGSR